MGGKVGDNIKDLPIHTICGVSRKSGRLFCRFNEWGVYDKSIRAKDLG